MKKIYIKIEGMHCAHCEDTIRNALLKYKNIKEVTFDGNIACILYNKTIDKQKIIESINENGYKTKDEYISEDKDKLKNNIKLKEFIVIAFLIILIVYLIYKIFDYNIFNVIPTIDSSITYGMLFVTGLLTSIHCISMCGAINLMAVIDDKRDLKRPFLYNVGRIISYTLIGGVVGLIGSVLSINDTVSGIIIIIASVIMFLVSLSMLGVIKHINIRLFKFRSKSKNPFIIGFLNGFMPCGPLQAMQVYALSTGSFFKGALSMLLFGLGTFPLMFMAGFILNIVKGKGKILVNKIASVLILLLSLVMFYRGLITLNIDVFSVFNDYSDFTPAVIEEDYQVIEFGLSYDSYVDLVVQVGIPVKMIIHVDSKYLTGCNNELVIDEYDIDVVLTEGDNIIEFIPDETGTFVYKCWMNMISNTIKVIDDIDYFEGGENEKDNT